MIRYFWIAAVILVLATGCGKRGPLESPSGGNAQHPKTYPQR